MGEASGPVRGNQGAAGLFFSTWQLNYSPSFSPPDLGALEFGEPAPVYGPRDTGH